MWKRFLALTLLTSAVFAESAESDVVQLSKATFEEVVNPESLILVEFFAPWCGHCKALAPEYETAATELKKSSIKLAKVDCTQETELCNDYGVQGYPTLKVFQNGTPKDYSGGRKADLIVDFMKRQALPAVSVLDSTNHDDFTKNTDVVLVAYFNKDDSDTNKTYSQVADRLRDDFTFGAVSEPDVIAAADVKTPSIVMYKTFDNPKEVFDGELNEEAITKFIKTSSIPLIGPIGPENFMSYHEAGLPLAYIFHKEADEAKTLADEYNAIAKEFKGKINFVTIDASKFGGHAGNLNLKEEWPAFAIQKPEDGGKFPFDQTKELNPDSVRAFVQDVIDGKVEPSLKSEAIPETQDEDVYVLVGKTFEEIAYDKTKDVLVEFYAPWCGHCKKLKPIWDELGAKYKPFQDKIIIAKMDATENDLPPTAGFQIQGFPTIKLFKANEEKLPPVDYSGDRSLESFIEFLDEHAVHKVEVSSESTGTAAEKPAETATEDEHDEL